LAVEPFSSWQASSSCQRNQERFRFRAPGAAIPEMYTQSNAVIYPILQGQQSTGSQLGRHKRGVNASQAQFQIQSCRGSRAPAPNQAGTNEESMPDKRSFNSGEGKPNGHERTFAVGWVAARIPEASGNARGLQREGANRRSRRAPPPEVTLPRGPSRWRGGGRSIRPGAPCSSR
jgi:hypothetical protein